MPDTETIEAPPPELLERLTAGLDRVAPLPKSKEPAPVQTTPVQTETVKTETVTTPEIKPEDRPLPSFIEKKGEPPTPEVKPDDWPEKLPGVTDEKEQRKWTEWRRQYGERGTQLEQLKSELETTKKRTGYDDPEVKSKIESLENENKKYKETFDKVYVEQSDWFQSTFSKPLEQLRGQAQDIVKEVEGNPEVVDKLLALKGKAYWEELDKVTSNLPEAAKISLTQIVNAIRGGEKNRDEVLSKSKEAAIELRKSEFQNQRVALEKQSAEHKQIYHDLITEMREKHGLEVLQRTTNPKEGWWNTDIVDKIEKGSEDTLFNNQDPRKLQAAVILGYAADTYRDMWIREHELRLKEQKQSADIRQAEPNLEESGGMSPTDNDNDLKKPLGSVFRKLLEQQRQG